jgi:CRP/FNR family cyclic AMP-dependent transcriptional regulator
MPPPVRSPGPGPKRPGPHHISRYIRHLADARSTTRPTWAFPRTATLTTVATAVAPMGRTTKSLRMRIEEARKDTPMTSHHELLTSVPLFANLPEKAIDDLNKTAIERQYEPGAEIVTEGAAGVAFFVITNGTAEVKRGDGDSQVATLTAGDCFGEMALIDGLRRSATVRAVTPLTCLAVTRWDFLALIRSDAGLAIDLLEAMSRRVRILEGRIAELEARCAG